MITVASGDGELRIGFFPAPRMRQYYGADKKPVKRRLGEWYAWCPFHSGDVQTERRRAVTKRIVGRKATTARMPRTL
jgi:hypothetical protein